MGQPKQSITPSHRRIIYYGHTDRRAEKWNKRCAGSFSTQTHYDNFLFHASRAL